MYRVVDWPVRKLSVTSASRVPDRLIAADADEQRQSNEVHAMHAIKVLRAMVKGRSHLRLVSGGCLIPYSPEVMPARTIVPASLSRFRDLIYQ